METVYLQSHIPDFPWDDLNFHVISKASPREGHHGTPQSPWKRVGSEAGSPSGAPPQHAAATSPAVHRGLVFAMVFLVRRELSPLSPSRAGAEVLVFSH